MLHKALFISESSPKVKAVKVPGESGSWPPLKGGKRFDAVASSCKAWVIW